MARSKNMTRRNFLEASAVTGAATALLGGVKAEAKDSPEPVSSNADVYYFGYGSNLNVEDTIGDLLPDGKFLMRAYLPNYQVQFRKWSNGYRGGISSIIETPGEMVEAALYSCPAGNLDHLDFRIDYYVPEYKRELFKVLGEDGVWYEAYLYRLWEPKGPFPPSRRYVEGMLAGARDIELSPKYIEMIEGFLANSIVAPD